MNDEQLLKLEEVSKLFEEMADLCGKFVLEMLIAEMKINGKLS